MASAGGNKGRIGDHIVDLSNQKSSAFTMAVGMIAIAAVLLTGGALAALGILGKTVATAGIMGIPSAWLVLGSVPLCIGLGVAGFRNARNLGNRIAAVQGQLDSPDISSRRAVIDVSVATGKASAAPALSTSAPTKANPAASATTARTATTPTTRLDGTGKNSSRPSK